MDFLTPDCVPSKTKRMAEVLDPLNHQVQELESLSNAEATSYERSTYRLDPDVYNKIVNECNNLIDMPVFDQYTQIEYIKDRISECLEEYKGAFSCCLEGSDFELTYSILHEIASRLLPHITDMMFIQDTIEIDKLQKCIENCCSVLGQIENAPSNEGLAIVFRIFLGDVSECMECLLNRISQLQSRKQKLQLMLCVSQIRKCLPMLWKTLCEDEEPDMIKVTKSYLVQRMDFCFKEISKILVSATPTYIEEIEGYGSQFVHKMDRILVMLDADFHHGDINQYPNMLADLKLMSDEILSNAMMLVQHCQENDHGPIRGGCLKVLHAYKDLEEECKKSSPNSNVCLLYANSMDHALQYLERAVNTAVLRMVLEVFCDPYAPLKEMMQKCSSPEVEMFERQPSDLNDLISVYDRHMERMMQIGYFAMACTRSPKKMLEIQSVLASLESLEAEVVPTLSAYYYEPMCPQHLTHLRVLTAHWQGEVAKFQTVLDSIIDPAAFCMVTLEELTPMLVKIKDNLHVWDKVVLKDNVNGVVKRAVKFDQLVSTAANETKPYSVALRLFEMLLNLRAAYSEVKTVARHVLAERENHDCVLGRDRLYKRCELTFSRIRKFKHILVRLMGLTQSKEESVEGTAESSKPSVREYRVGAESTKSEPVEDYLGDLEPLARRGKQLEEERSILYTPARSGLKKRRPYQWPTTSKAKRLNRLFCRDTIYDMEVSFPNLDKNESVSDVVGNDITQILDKMTSLVNTFTVLQTSAKSQKKKRKIDENENSSSCSYFKKFDDFYSQYAVNSTPSSPKSSTEATALVTSPTSSTDREEVQESDLKVKAIFVGSDDSTAESKSETTEKPTCESGSAFSSLSVDCKTVCHPADISSGDVDTPQRLMDLNAVDRKISALKTKLMAS